MAGELATRTATALVVGGAALALTLAGGVWTLAFVGLLLAALAWEHAAMWATDRPIREQAVDTAVPCALGLALAVAVSDFAGGGLPPWYFALFFVAGAAAVLGAPHPRRRVARAAMALAWFAPAAVAAVVLRQEFGFATLAWPVLIVIASDVGAFMVGRAVGGPKLAPRISPSKTWSGLAGGLLVGAISGLAASLIFYDDAPLTALPVALAVVLSGVAGDLAESALKRRAGVKDSGSLLPGHGGVFDRFDSHLFALPVFALIACAFGWPL